MRSIVRGLFLFARRTATIIVMTYQVKLDQFSGPLDKLLELIEARQIEITQLSLANVTGDFISYVEQLEKENGIDVSVLSDFIAVAARLLLIKSKVLLPSLDLTEEEKVDIADLEHRLRVYREFKLAAAGIKALWDKKQVAHARPLLSALGESSFFYPPKGVTSSHLESSLIKLFTVLEGLFPETKTIRGKVVTLQEKISELTERLSKAASLTLRGKISKKDQQEVIVMFLAVLHMLANKLASVEQGEAFGDIIVSKSSEVGITNNEL